MWCINCILVCRRTARQELLRHHWLNFVREMSRLQSIGCRYLISFELIMISVMERDWIWCESVVSVEHQGNSMCLLFQTALPWGHQLCILCFRRWLARHRNSASTSAPLSAAFYSPPPYTLSSSTCCSDGTRWCVCVCGWCFSLTSWSWRVCVPAASRHSSCRVFSWCWLRSPATRCCHGDGAGPVSPRPWRMLSIWLLSCTRLGPTTTTRTVWLCSGRKCR